jgi:hypothetical protein
MKTLKLSILKRPFRRKWDILKWYIKIVRLLFAPTNIDVRRINRYIRPGFIWNRSYIITYIRALSTFKCIPTHRITNNSDWYKALKLKSLSAANRIIQIIDFSYLMAFSIFLILLSIENLKTAIPAEVIPTSNYPMDEIPSPPDSPLLVIVVSSLMIIFVLTVITRSLWQLDSTEIPPCFETNNLNAATRVSLNIQGPISELELVQVERFLYNQALIENLSISPIGDLWVDPW